MQKIAAESVVKLKMFSLLFSFFIATKPLKLEQLLEFLVGLFLSTSFYNIIKFLIKTGFGLGGGCTVWDFF